VEAAVHELDGDESSRGGSPVDVEYGILHQVIVGMRGGGRHDGDGRRQGGQSGRSFESRDDRRKTTRSWEKNIKK
jgi:hypothetical protein